MEIFSSEKVSEHVTRIVEITGTYMYLVQGTEKALLIDTGCGIGKLKEYIETLTKKPLIVVCTHGHMDHAGGADAFEEVYLNNADWQLSLTHCSLENRKKYVQMTVSKLHPQIAQEKIETAEYQKTRTKPYHQLEDNMVFELGEISVQALAMPGHTQGSMCMLLQEERNILFGDACTPSEFLFDEEAGYVEDYKDTLIGFQKYESLYDDIWMSHGPCISWPKELLSQTIDVCKEIMAGTDEKSDFHFFMGGNYKAAHEMLPNQMRKDGGLANIIYNPEKVFRNNGGKNEIQN